MVKSLKEQLEIQPNINKKSAVSYSNRRNSYYRKNLIKTGSLHASDRSDYNERPRFTKINSCYSDVPFRPDYHRQIAPSVAELRCLSKEPLVKEWSKWSISRDPWEWFKNYEMIRKRVFYY